MQVFPNEVGVAKIVRFCPRGSVLGIFALIVIILGILTGGLPTRVSVLTSPVQASPLLSHIPIEITSDAGFTAANGVVAGTGTFLDPFIISGWDIKINSVLAPPNGGIDVSGTTKYFVIRNNSIHDGTVGGSYFPAVRFTNVKNAIVEQNFFSQTFGVETDSSSNNIFRNNELSQNMNGFWLRTSSYNLLADNNYTIDCATAPSLFCVNVPLIGFEISNGSNNTLVRNLAQGGIWGYELDSCLPQPPPCANTSGNYLAYNRALNNGSNGYLVNGAYSNTLEFNQAIGNADEGYLIEYANNELVRSNIATDNSLAGLLFQFSTGDIVSDNVASGSIGTGSISPDQVVSWGAGVGLFNAANNLVTSNDVFNNAAGIALSLSNHNTVSSNISHGNGNGVTLFDSSDLNTFEGNRVYGNLGYAGVYFDVVNGGASTGNLFHSNYVYKNPIGFFVADLYPGIGGSPQTNETIVGNYIFGNNRLSDLPLFPFSNTGLYVDGTSQLNITGNFIFNNPTGLYWGTMFPGGQNLVYNNFFANTVNVNDFTQNLGCEPLNPCALNQYNVTKTLRTNIIGGEYTGGNYWSDYAGIDNVGDGIGHTMLPFQPGCCGLTQFFGGDYYPLVFPSPTGVNVLLFSSPDPWAVSEGSQGSLMLGFISRNSFAGSLSLSTTTSPNYSSGPVVALNSTSVSLSAGGAAVTFLNATDTVIPGAYTIQLMVDSSTLPLALRIVSEPIVSAVRGLDNTIYASRFESSWSSWQTGSGSTASGPVICSGSDSDRLEMVVRGADNSTIWHRSQIGGVLSAWDTPGGVSNAEPACAILGNTLYLVVKGLDNSLWTNSLNLVNGVWGGWSSLGGATDSAPVLVASTSWRLDLVVKTPASAILHRAFTNGGWASSWDSPGGSTPSAPAVVSDSQLMHLVVRGADNGLWYNSLNFTTDSWNGWVSLPGSTLYSPRISEDGVGRLHIVVVGLDGGVWHMSKLVGSAWNTGWESLGGVTSTTPQLSSMPDGVLVLVKGGDSGLWSGLLVGSTWTGWTGLGGSTPSSPTVSP